jgi:hypothetical protein
MGARTCTDCVVAPVMRCGRCTNTVCARHALAPGVRCNSCEREWADEAPTRRSAKLIFAPSIAILAGGLLFGLLLPVSLGGLIGAVLMCAFACGAAVGAGAGACSLVERSSRALFLRERAGDLPAARLLPSPRHR